ncbi:SDR family oxidoreductase [Phormidium tenue]|uniref:NAD(P)-dependent oxidoreductase n=1 Tax=Phormidium tenue NIES-30 TaxID=549789 RepID=A0A1U7J6W8_9CYAN|nr:SDR family oxidoreductase [Phormidium tenue]MBD2233582.1 SDR family oxidoreductase [Phormidium tenue FACHB-1052]OKH48683.1 NAD(P)-dependent oxidoreductase [Phormidium tenue NIES-30]
MNAAILGCGYVGKAVAQLWGSQGVKVTATTTNPDRIEELRSIAAAVQVVQGSDAGGIAALLQDQDTLLICVGAGRQANYEEVYLKTAQTVVGALDQAPSLKQIIFTSSYSVYGNYDGAWVREDDPVKPATDNARTMAETEQTLLKATTPERNVCIFRLGGIYGLGRELAKIYSRAAGTTRPGSGHEGSNWIHLDDIVGAIAFAQSQSLSGLYNLVQDEIPTVRELIDRVCQAHQLEPVQWDPSQPSARPYNVRVSNRKLKAAGYTFRHSTFEGI